MSDSTQWFPDRLKNVSLYRPSYPPGVVKILRESCMLAAGAPVAEIGSGTGAFTRHLLEQDLRVIGVEPDSRVRSKAENLLSDYPLFQSWDGVGEETGLPDAAVEAVVLAQMLPLLRPDRSRQEFRRILKPGGWVLVVWNERMAEATAFLRAFESLLREYSSRYRSESISVPRRPQIREFLGHSRISARIIQHQQRFTWDGLRARLLMSPGVPRPGDSDCPAMIRRLGQIFDLHNEQGFVYFRYTSRAYWGRLL